MGIGLPRLFALSACCSGSPETDLEIDNCHFTTECVENSHSLQRLMLYCSCKQITRAPVVNVRAEKGTSDFCFFRTHSSLLLSFLCREKVRFLVKVNF